MKEDLETKLYNSYFNGEKGAFDLLYNKYKERIQYFIYNIVKDYQKAEDITQDVFVYILQNKMKEEYSFKYYIYLIAKSRALNYVNTKSRKQEINEQYFLNETNKIQEDLDEIVAKNEIRKKTINAINLLNDKYKNAIYLVKIEEFSYKEAASILGESVQNVKNLVHRGKNKLREILLKQDINNMNKVLKIFIIILCTTIILSGMVYVTAKIIESIKTKLTPIFTSEVENIDTNTIWIGSFQIAWNEFMNTRINGNVEFINEKSKLAEELNKQTFTKDMLSSDDYYIKVEKTSNELKKEILKDIKNKFGIKKSYALNKINFNKNPEDNSYTIYSILYKKFNFLKPFDREYSATFNGRGLYKYFGIVNSSSEELNNNVEVLFYNNEKDYAVKLKTKENEDVILYLNNSNNSFDDLYNEIEQKTKEYKGNTTFTKNDELSIPYINISATINYDELCNKVIKGTEGIYIENAIQNVKFYLNEKGGNLLSEAAIQEVAVCISDNPRYFYNTPFVVFLKESNKEKPYFAVKINNADLLVKSTTEENVIK